jgi:tetratricopeptide (TPR) repeat protein
MQPPVIFRDKSERVLTDKDIASVTGKVDYEIVGASNVSPKARELHALARQAGSTGDFSKALSLLSQASKEAPEWPYPVYDRAYTYLLMDQADKALEDYRSVVKMRPRGFFTAITAADSLSREKSGQWKSGTYKQYLTLEWVSDASEKKALLEKMVQVVPNFAPAWKSLSTLLDDDAEKLRAIESGLAQNPDAETEGVLLVNKALALNRQGKQEEAISILGELALDPNVPLDVEQIAKMSLASMTRDN